MPREALWETLIKKITPVMAGVIFKSVLTNMWGNYLKFPLNSFLNLIKSGMDTFCT